MATHPIVHNIVLDVGNLSEVAMPFRLKQSDYGSHVFVFDIQDKKQAYELEGCTYRVRFLREDFATTDPERRIARCHYTRTAHG